MSTFKKSNTRTNFTRINEKIRAKEIRVIDDEGKQLGVLQKSDAVDMAKERGLDLVEVAPDANPPVCRIMDYGKFRYEQTKKEKEAKKKQVSIKIKEIKFRPTTDTHDYEIKLNHAKEFLEKGYKVKITMTFRGREMAHTAEQKKKLIAFGENLNEFGSVEKEAKMLGRNMILIVGPKKKKK